MGDFIESLESVFDKASLNSMSILRSGLGRYDVEIHDGVLLCCIVGAFKLAHLR